MTDATAINAEIATLSASVDTARTNLQNLEAKLSGLRSARPSFIASNTFSEAKVYDQDIADAQLAVEQARYQLKAAEEAEIAAIYAEDQAQKTAVFAAATLTSTIFWAMFDDAYMNAAIQLMSVIEAAEAMSRQIATINANNRPDAATALGSAGNVLDLIRSKLYIPGCDGAKAYFMYRQRTVQYPEGTDPVADFLKQVTDRAASVLAAAANPATSTA